VDGLVGGGGEDEQLVPLVRQQAGVDLHGDLVVEGKAAGPLDQLVDDAVADAAELVRQVGGAVVQQVVHVLTWENILMRLSEFFKRRSLEMLIQKCFSKCIFKHFYLNIFKQLCPFVIIYQKTILDVIDNGEKGKSLLKYFSID